MVESTYISLAEAAQQMGVDYGNLLIAATEGRLTLFGMLNKWVEAERGYDDAITERRNIAASRGGVTLEMLLERRNIEMPAWDQSSRVSMDAWKTISRRYAEGVSGDVRAVVGEELRAGNVWENVELPRLSKNHSVTSIVQIDPATEAEHSIMTRSPSGEVR